MNVFIADYGERSVWGIPYPLDLNKAPFSILKMIPGIGKKRATAITLNRPFRDIGHIEEIIGISYK